MTDLYHTDIYAWSQQQAALLRKADMIPAYKVKAVADTVQHRLDAARRAVEADREAGRTATMYVAQGEVLACTAILEALRHISGVEL